MSDLDQRLDKPVDEYDVLMIAPLLRKLLLDANPLVHQVNRKRRVKFRFRYSVNGYRAAVAALNPVFWAAQDGLDPATKLTTGRSDEGKLANFLGVTVITVREHRYTVRDVIDLVANVEGGVHAGVSREQRQAILQAVEHSIQIGGLPPPSALCWLSAV